MPFLKKLKMVLKKLKCCRKRWRVPDHMNSESDAMSVVHGSSRTDARLVIDATALPASAKINLTLGVGDYDVQYQKQSGQNISGNVTFGVNAGALIETGVSADYSRATGKAVTKRMRSKQIVEVLEGNRHHNVFIKQSSQVRTFDNSKIVKNWPLISLTVVLEEMNAMKYLPHQEFEKGNIDYLMAQPLDYDFKPYHKLVFDGTADVTIRLISTVNDRGTIVGKVQSPFSIIEGNRNETYKLIETGRARNKAIEQFIHPGVEVLRKQNCHGIRVIISGNPGIGKSTLASSMTNDNFVSGCSNNGTGMTVDLQHAKYIYDERITLTDTPGLACIKNKKKAAAAINQAFKNCIEHGLAVKLIFMVKLYAGRIDCQDVMTINDVIKSIKLPGNLRMDEKIDFYF